MTPAPTPGAPHSFSALVDQRAVGQRVDQFLANAVEGVSRSQIRRSFDQGLCRVDGQVCKPSHRLALGERVEWELAEPILSGPQPEPIALDILYQDEALIVVNKPPGMVVHPAKGHWSGTLAGALLAQFGALSSVGGPTRPGIVHRLDRDTSGVIVVAKTNSAHTSLADQFQNRTVEKEYLAIVTGCPDRDRDRIEEPIGPHPSHREKMALRSDHPDSRPAETFYEVLERYRGFSLIRAVPKTGRTHQIRLHLVHARHPVLCDRLYGGRSQITAGELRAITRCKQLGAEVSDETVLLNRQALHAHRLVVDHPVTGERQEFLAPLAPDIEQLRVILHEHAGRE